MERGREGKGGMGKGEGLVKDTRIMRVCCGWKSLNVVGGTSRQVSMASLVKMLR